MSKLYLQYLKRKKKDNGKYYLFKSGLFYIFIYDNNKTKGIPIGNYTSQYFTNIYLDKYIKEELKINYYVRYMDDFVLLVKTKEECIYLKNKINDFLNERIHLELNSKSRYYPNRMGVNFCGYHIFETHILVRTRSKKKIRDNIKKWNKLYQTNKLNINKMFLSLNSWLGHVKDANSYNLVNKNLNNINYFKIECHNETRFFLCKISK